MPWQNMPGAFSPPEAMVELVLNMRSPKNTFWQAPKLISLHKLRYPSMVTQFNPDYYFGPCVAATPST